MKQSCLRKLFMVKYAVEVNDVWVSPVTITSKNKYNLHIFGAVSCNPDESEHKEEFTLTTNEGVKVKIPTT